MQFDIGDEVRILSNPDTGHTIGAVGIVVEIDDDDATYPIRIRCEDSRGWYAESELEPAGFTLKDSGQRQEFATGSVRDTREGKGRYDLLPPAAIRRLAQQYERGAAKYGDRNWEKGQPLSRYLDSALRHVFAVLEGKQDEDHAIAGAWNLLAFVHTEEAIRAGVLPASLDDMAWTTEEADSE